VRPALPLYTDSTMTLDPNTGKPAWHFQHQNNDEWDFDWALEASSSSCRCSDRAAPCS